MTPFDKEPPEHDQTVQKRDETISWKLLIAQVIFYIVVAIINSILILFYDNSLGEAAPGIQPVIDCVLTFTVMYFSYLFMPFPESEVSHQT